MAHVVSNMSKLLNLSLLIWTITTAHGQENDYGYLRAAEDNSVQIEKFLMENDKNWDRDRHCDWVILTPNPHTAKEGDYHCTSNM